MYEGRENIEMLRRQMGASELSQSRVLYVRCTLFRQTLRYNCLRWSCIAVVIGSTILDFYESLQ